MSVSAETCRGSVNAWECDEMGHMNVQFYMSRLDDALTRMSELLGLGRGEAVRRGVTLRCVSNHVRFLAELRMADMLAIDSGILEADETGITVYSEMAHVAAGRPAATFTSRLEAYDLAAGGTVPVPGDVVERASAYGIARPEHGAPRGLDERHGMPLLNLGEADARGLTPIYHGAVQPHHCNAYGWNSLQYYTSRISDGVPNLWQDLAMERAKMLEARRGVAVVEFTWAYYRPLLAGDTLTARSMVRGVSRRTIQLAHYIFNAGSGELACVSEAMVVVLDLEARRAAELSEEEIHKFKSAVLDIN